MDEAARRGRRYLGDITDVTNIRRRHERDTQVIPRGADQAFSGRSIFERGDLLWRWNAGIVAVAGSRSKSFQRIDLSLTI
jgi:hypothetical protein